MTAAMASGRKRIIEQGELAKVLDVLRRRGFRVVGPKVEGGAIIYDELGPGEALPRGLTERQEAGRYRLEKRDDDAIFAYAVGSHSWKKFTLPARLKLWRAERRSDQPVFAPDDPRPPPFAFIGVRSCDLHAIAIQDKVFLGGAFRDESYRERRQDAFIVAVNCAEPGGTCFCVSMRTGPKANTGFDLALTELIEDARHVFLVEIGTERGADVLSELDSTDASSADTAAADAVSAGAAKKMGRQLETEGLPALLTENPEHPRWDDVAARCLTCGNCTMVCPTCFCTSVEDVGDLIGEAAERWRRWDSCFTLDFSAIHGGSVRRSAKGRYRQWMTHKLATWHDQFDTSGCVGCGRCLTWCPVGIDITEEAAAIRESLAKAEKAPG